MASHANAYIEQKISIPPSNGNENLDNISQCTVEGFLQFIKGKIKEEYSNKGNVLSLEAAAALTARYN